MALVTKHVNKQPYRFTKLRPRLTMNGQNSPLPQMKREDDQVIAIFCTPGATVLRLQSKHLFSTRATADRPLMIQIVAVAEPAHALYQNVLLRDGSDL